MPTPSYGDRSRRVGHHGDQDERVVVGSVLEHALLALVHTMELRSEHFHSWVHGAAFRAAVTMADIADDGERALAVGRRFDRLPPGYDLSTADVAAYLAYATSVPETIAHHVAAIRDRYAERCIAAELAELRGNRS